MSKSIRVYEVAYNLTSDGRFDDGVEIFRTKNKREAEDFAYGKRIYSGPATVEVCEVPAKIAKRWGF